MARSVIRRGSSSSAVIPAEAKLLTVEQFAAALNLSVSCIRAWIAQHKVEFVRVGGAIRFSRDYVDRFIESRTVKVAAQ